MPASPEPGGHLEPGPVVDGWEHGASRRFISLAVARGGAQLVGVGWFVLSARAMSGRQFGILATGLTFFALFAGLGDLGTTRTIVRHVAADHRALWPAYQRALSLRVAAGVGVAAAVTAIVVALDGQVSPAVVALAGLTATASGVSELGYAGLRSVGRVRVEVVLLPAERLAFLGAAGALLATGHGALSVLVTYAATNTASALLVTALVRRSRDPVSVPTGPFLDREARFTAAGFALATAGPRISPVVLSFVVAPATVGVFVAAQRPVEAIALLALSVAAPVFPIVRSRLAAGKEGEALAASVSVLAAIMLGSAPVVTWMLVHPADVLEALFGADRPADGEVVVRLLAVTALTWSFRGVAESVLLAQDRATTVFIVTAVGVIGNLVLALALVGAHGAEGAAIATVAAELAMTGLLLRFLPAMTHPRALAKYATAGIAAGATALALLAVGTSLGASLVVVGAATLASGVVCLRLLRGLEVAR